MSCGRFRHFGIIFYGTAIELDSILLKYMERISNYAYILHDKDIYDDTLIDDDGHVVHTKGDIKKPHYHILVDFYNACSVNACSKLFITETDNPKVVAINDMVASYRYLTHKDDKNQYQYSSTAIVSSDINYYEKMTIMGAKKDSDNIAVQIVEDILNKVNPRIMLARYGRDFAIHRQQYYDMAWEIQEFERMEKARLGDDIVQEKIPF